jgi:predicted chitinase
MWETARRFTPVTEFGQPSYFNKYDAGTPIGRRLGNMQPGDGFRFRGRGYVQITGRANYEGSDGCSTWI